MKNPLLILPALFILYCSCSYSSEEVNLAEKMSSLQHLTHKTALAIDHNNSSLARFYAHELGVSVHKLLKVDIDHGIPVGLLVKTTLLPALDKLQQRVDSSDWQASSAALDDLIDSCNECHLTSGHDFIVIQRHSINPYFQSFQPRE